MEQQQQHNNTAVNGNYLSELKNEIDNLDASYVHCQKLLTQEMEKAELESKEGKDNAKKFTARWIDVTESKPVKIQEKVPIPVQEHPKYNFVGTLLGPKGSTLKRLQEETGTKMAILGRGSVRDKSKEEEMRKEGGKYAHLNEDLHVMVEAFAPVGAAYGRLGHALAELRKFLVPELNNDIRQHQFDQLVDMGQLSARGGGARGGGRGGGRGGMAGPTEGPPAGGPYGAERAGGPYGAERGRGRGGAPGRGAPRGRGGPPPARGAPSGRGGMPARRDPYAEEAPAYRDDYARVSELNDFGRRGAPARRGGMPPRRDPYADEAPAYRDEYEAPAPAPARGGYGDRGGYEQDYDQTYGGGSDTKYFDYGHGSTGAGAGTAPPARDPYGYEEPSYGGDSWSTGAGRAGGGAMKPAPRAMGGARSQAHPYGGGPARY